ncbi:MAG TPA: hypothetical protein VMW54_07235 [Terriglobia bacterium]|nr:hypothetical protein [Terriglobia bacterium]
MDIGERIEKQARQRKERIEKLVAPPIREALKAYREAVQALHALGKSPPEELVKEIEQRLLLKGQDIAKRYPSTKKTNSEPTGPETIYARRPSVFDETKLRAYMDGPAIFEHLHWKRHSKPLQDDLSAGNGKNWEARQRVLRTVSDVEQLRCGQGPIKPFKTGIDHSDVFDFVLGFGLEKLTSEELADFFNEYCPCGRNDHDPERLKKQRARRLRTFAAITRE